MDPSAFPPVVRIALAPQFRVQSAEHEPFVEVYLSGGLSGLLRDDWRAATLVLGRPADSHWTARAPDTHLDPDCIAVVVAKSSAHGTLAVEWVGGKRFVFDLPLDADGRVPLDAALCLDLYAHEEVSTEDVDATPLVTRRRATATVPLVWFLVASHVPNDFTAPDAPSSFCFYAYAQTDEPENVGRGARLARGFVTVSADPRNVPGAAAHLRAYYQAIDASEEYFLGYSAAFDAKTGSVRPHYVAACCSAGFAPEATACHRCSPWNYDTRLSNRCVGFAGVLPMGGVVPGLPGFRCTEEWLLHQLAVVLSRGSREFVPVSSESCSAIGGLGAPVTHAHAVVVAAVSTAWVASRRYVTDWRFEIDASSPRGYKQVESDETSNPFTQDANDCEDSNYMVAFVFSHIRATKFKSAVLQRMGEVARDFAVFTTTGAAHNAFALDDHVKLATHMYSFAVPRVEAEAWFSGTRAAPTELRLMPLEVSFAAQNVTNKN